MKRVHSQLASVYRVPLSALVEDLKKKSPQVKKKKKPSPSVPKRQVSVPVTELSEEEVNDDVTPPSEVVIEKNHEEKEKVSKKTRRKKPAQKQEGKLTITIHVCTIKNIVCI